jgi:chorismate synthase
MNSIGRLLRFSVFGESHGPAIGCLLDGCPPGIPLAASDFEADLARRRPGAAGTTPRRETDPIEILSGLHNGHTTGSPLAAIVRNGDTRSSDYDRFARQPRPGHADFTSRVKYFGFSDPRGSGHFSGRVTAGLVLAGVVAKKMLPGIRFDARILEIGGISRIDDPAGCDAAIARAVAEEDSLGGVIGCTVSGLPAGLGEPFADSTESLLAHWLFAVPAIRGLEFGEGFAASRRRGSEHNDPILDETGRTATNNCGGINGGITNGNDLVLRIAVKPASSIARPQFSYDFATGRPRALVVEGRHDACIALRMPVVAEAACALALADLILIRNAYRKEKP